jgi:rhodanese-related sulfurtransferase
MRTSTFPACVFGLLVSIGLLTSTPSIAAPSAHAIRVACHPGTDKQTPGSDYPGGFSKVGGGLTPTSLPGAIVVSVAEAKCIIDKFPNDVVVIAAISDARRLPGAVSVPWAASADPSEEGQGMVANAFLRLAGGDKHRPLIIYCHSDHCFLSYNATLRAVKAGFTSVFWMRPGIEGWVAAGYDVDDPLHPKIEQGLTAAYVKEIRECDENYFDYNAKEYAYGVVQFISPSDSDKSWEHDIAQTQNYRKVCLHGVRQRFAGNAPALADLEARLSRTDAEVAGQYRKARAEVEANPATYFTEPLEHTDADKLRSQLELGRNMQTTAQHCGSFDFSMPSMDNDVISSLTARRTEYGHCLEEWRNERSFTFAKVEFKLATAAAVATERFTCAKRRAANCLPDAVWHRVGDIATPANLEVMDRADAIYSNRDKEVNDEIERLNQWVDDVNAAVERYNES